MRYFKRMQNHKWQKVQNREKEPQLLMWNKTVQNNKWKSDPCDHMGPEPYPKINDGGNNCQAKWRDQLQD